MARKQKGKLTISFEDGTSREIDLQHLTVIGTSESRLQSIAIMQRKNGEWGMAITAGLLKEGSTKLHEMKFEKVDA